MNRVEKDFFQMLLNKIRRAGISNIEDSKLVANFLTNFELYNRTLEKALADGVISVDDKAELYKFRAKIFSDNLHLIQEDNGIDEAEALILSQILQTLNFMRDHESKFPSMV